MKKRIESAKGKPPKFYNRSSRPPTVVAKERKVNVRVGSAQDRRSSER